MSFRMPASRGNIQRMRYRKVARNIREYEPDLHAAIREELGPGNRTDEKIGRYIEKHEPQAWERWRLH